MRSYIIQYRCYINLHKYVSILQDQLKKDTLFNTHAEWLFTISFVAAWCGINQGYMPWE